MLKPVYIQEEQLVILDQRLLPQQEKWLHLKTVDEVFQAIRDMAVRGAPAIGIAAAVGMAIASKEVRPGEDFAKGMTRAGEKLISARPTAVNLEWAVKKMLDLAVTLSADMNPSERTERLFKEAQRIHDEDIRMNLAIGRFGGDLLPEGAIMTHCNAGSLATGGYGTALGMIRGARDAGKRIRVVACETRPYLQGARLTAWEMMQDGFDVTLITDNMSGHIMARGMIQAVVVGADRIAANGDTANKIGTYTHAVLARRHNIPFYVAAPWSTIDLGTPTGSDIVIEERNPNEVTFCGGTRIAPQGVKVFNPAFDVTPAQLITAIITDRGIFRPSIHGIDWTKAKH